MSPRRRQGPVGGKWKLALASLFLCKRLPRFDDMPCRHMPLPGAIALVGCCALLHAAAVAAFVPASTVTRQTRELEPYYLSMATITVTCH